MCRPVFMLEPALAVYRVHIWLLFTHLGVEGEINPRHGAGVCLGSSSITGLLIGFEGHS